MPSSYSNRGSKFALALAALSLLMLTGQAQAEAEDKLPPGHPSDQNQANDPPPFERSNEPGEFSPESHPRIHGSGQEFRSRIQDRMNERLQNRRQERMRARAGAKSLGKSFAGRPLDLSILGLSDEQKEKIQGLRKTLAPNARKIRLELKNKRDELRSLMFDPSASDSALKAKQKEVHKAQEQLENLQLDDFLQMRSVLTPEQRQKLPELKPTRPQPKMPQANTSPQHKPLPEMPPRDSI
jgi:Spy/CpxP family protein refolding chaperone